MVVSPERIRSNNVTLKQYSAVVLTRGLLSRGIGQLFPQSLGIALVRSADYVPMRSGDEVRNFVLNDQITDAFRGLTPNSLAPCCLPENSSNERTIIPGMIIWHLSVIAMY